MRQLFLVIVFCFGSKVLSQDDIQALGELPESISETSGLIFFNGRMITHNDSNGLPELYEIDTISLQILRTVTIENVQNTDWEDIAQDDDYIYIGDIGNNQGNRQDLKIHKILKTDYLQSESVIAEAIDFFYEDQTDFTAQENSDFDAEALFVLGDNLIILTKQWQSMGTVAYRIPKLPGAFLAERLDSYQVDGLVTGATFNAAIDELYLVGYSQFLTPFFARIENVDSDTIFSGTITKSNLNVGFAQMEAITQVENIFYMSSEEFTNSNPPVNSSSRLFRFTLNSDNGPEEPIDPPEEPNPEPEEGLILYRSFGSAMLNYQLNTNSPIFGMGIFDNIGRLVQFTPLESIPEQQIDISAFSPSNYYLGFFYGNQLIAKPFIVN